MTPTNKGSSIPALAGIGSAWLVAMALAGCGRADVTAANHGIRQTGFPGQITAGGDTSGRVLARNAPAAPAAPAPAASSSQAPQETARGQSTTGSVAGTPSIGEGSGGTTSGAEMGGTTPGAAATKSAPGPGGAAPSVPAQENRK